MLSETTLSRTTDRGPRLDLRCPWANNSVMESAHDDLWQRCLAELPEPAKSQAKAQRKSLLERGTAAAEAERTALATAAKWVAERAPHVHAPYLEGVVERAALDAET